MIQVRPSPARRVVFLELNEAERHFLDLYVADGKLPNFRRALEQGAIVRTRVPGHDAGRDRHWRAISPWIVWPSIYTGLAPEQHGLIGFGQDPAPIVGRCVWDVLDQAGLSTGVLGSLMSYPPRNAGSARWYVPESLANTPECFPPEARPLQEFCVHSARNYSEGFGRNALRSLRLLARTRRSGVRPSTIARTLAQVPRELVRGASVVPERAMLHSYLTADAFFALYRKHRPDYASVHMNHVAYVQHRYWRAAEPERFADELSPTDERFFRDVPARKRYERDFAGWIEKSFVWTDGFLGQLFELADERTVILIGTGLGQRPYDPAREIHNPVVRLVRERELFDRLDLANYAVLHQMNPDVTVNLADEAAAARAERILGGLYAAPSAEPEPEPLFAVQRRGAQVFCELNMPRRATPGQRFTIRHKERADVEVDLGRHLLEQNNADQSTAHHKDSGWLLGVCPGARVQASEPVVRVTDVAPTILSLFGLPPAPWMPKDAHIALTVEP